MGKQPKKPFHPGEMLLEEFLEPMGMSQAAFAQKIGWSRARLIPRVWFSPQGRSEAGEAKPSRIPGRRDSDWMSVSRG